MDVDRDDGTASFTYFDFGGECTSSGGGFFKHDRAESETRAAAMERWDKVDDEELDSLRENHTAKDAVSRTIERLEACLAANRYHSLMSSTLNA
jgi:hypothetical protein